MSPKEITIMESVLLSYGKHVDVLEWGSGGSTVYFPQFLRNKGVSYTWTSIEYNRDWYERISGIVKDDKDIKLTLFDVGNMELKQRYIPMDEYVAYPRMLGVKYDVIFVDGRKRRRCLLEASKLLKPKGTVLLHDARRTYYHHAFSAYQDSRIVLWTGLWCGRLENPGVTRKIINLLLYWCFRVYTLSFRFRHMKSIKTILLNTKTHVLNLLKKGEKIIESKSKWNELARENARYYILTNKSISDSETSFRLSGEQDVKNNFLDDEIIRNIIGYDKKSKALEIGCGIGRLSEFIAPHVNKLYGVDISEEMISRAKDRLNQQKNIIFMATDGASFPIDNESVDVVLSFIVFQHMPSVKIIRKNIEEISRVLKTGGVAKIQLRGIPVSKSNWYYGPSFNEAGVEKLVKGTSLKVLKSEGAGQKYFWVWLKK